MTKRELKQEIDQLRNDMAAEFVNRDKVIEAHTTHLETFHKLVGGWAKDLGNLDKRVEQLNEHETMTVDVVRGLMRYLGTDISKLERCIKEAKAAYEKMIFEMPQSRSKDEPQSRRRKDTEDIYLSSATRKLPQMPRNYVEKAMAACGIPIRYKEGEEGRAEYRIISREDVQKLADYVRMFLPKEGME